MIVTEKTTKVYPYPYPEDTIYVDAIDRKVGIREIAPTHELDINGQVEINTTLAPIITPSTTKVINLNVDALDGYHGAESGVNIYPFTKADGKLSTVVIPPVEVVVGAGDIRYHSADTVRSTVSSAYTLMKEIVVVHSGIYRIYFELRASGISPPVVYARIYRNGSAVGTERATTSATFVAFTEDIAGWAVGDRAQLYARATNVDYPAEIQRFRLFTNKHLWTYATKD